MHVHTGIPTEDKQDWMCFQRLYKPMVRLGPDPGEKDIRKETAPWVVPNHDADATVSQSADHHSLGPTPKGRISSHVICEDFVSACGVSGSQSHQPLTPQSCFSFDSVTTSKH